MRAKALVDRGRWFVWAVSALALSAVACERVPDADSAASDSGDILVGMYGSLTGDGASFGQSSLRGTELAVEEINNAGGLLGGRQIRLLVEDNQSRPEEAANAVTKLITQDGVVALLGEVASRRSLAAAPVAQRYQVPMITPASTNERVTEVGDYIFRICFIDSFQGQVLAKFAFDELGVRRVAVLRDIQQDYSVGLTDSIVKNFTELGGQVFEPVSYSTGDADFRAILTQVRSQKPEAMFVTGYYPEVSIIVRQARELGLNMPILGGDGWVGDSLRNGREALNNSYISDHWAADNPDPAVQTFVSTYRAKYNADPDSMAALAYDSVKVLADAITRAQTTESGALRDAIAAADVPGVTGRLRMNAQRNVDKPAVILELAYAEGQLKFVYRSTVNP
ncbi:MAG: ABC transporter substrate-binding protein [Vicinamibacterales bacterium]